jgi:hypothetical protein
VLGARIVAGVVLGLLVADPESYIRVKPEFEPDSAVKMDRKDFDMTALIKFAGAMPEADGVGTNMAIATKEQSVSADALGNLILEGIPYRYDEDGGEPRLMTVHRAREAGERKQGADVLSEDPNDIYATVDGPAKNNNAIDRLSSDDENEIRTHPTDSIWWGFGGKFYRVTKAVKIPYEVKQDGVTVTKHILVGYMGVDGGGG